jgi:hypothetical protein
VESSSGGGPHWQGGAGTAAFPIIGDLDNDGDGQANRATNGTNWLRDNLDPLFRNKLGKIVDEGTGTSSSSHVEAEMIGTVK